MTENNEWWERLSEMPGREQQIVSIADATCSSGESIIAGWVASRDQDKIQLIDGSGYIELTAPGLNAQIGDLITCRLAPNGNGLQHATPLIVARSTQRARRILETWSPSDTEIAYRHRYVHLRNPRHGQALREASRFRYFIYRFLSDRGFTHVDTPILSRTQCEYTDDDYIVVSRYIDRGVYSLPQSAKLYKQLLMGAGIWRYFQFSRCFRDEPIHADSLTEFTQIDVEVAFSTQESLMSLAEELIAAAFREMKGIEIERPFLRMSIAEALSEYGADKPLLTAGGHPLGLFITGMPMAYLDSNNKLRGRHHPMMAPDPRHLPLDPGKPLTDIRSTGFNIVIGGIEVGSGNMRISDYALQNTILDILKFSKDDRKELLGTLLEGLEFALPPHGGFGVGFERLLMALTDKDSLQDVIAFPKLRRDWCPLTRSPFTPRPEALNAYHQALNSISEAAQGISDVGKDRPLFVNSPIEDAPTARISAALNSRGGCAFPMHIGDSHLPPPMSFAEAVRSRMSNATMVRYSQPGGLPTLREFLALRFSERIGVKIDTDQVLICNGATEVTYLILQIALAPGNRAIVLSPHWPLIVGQVRQSRCIADEAPFFERGRAPSPDQIRGILEANLKPSTRLIYFANPNNPDGAIMGLEQLEVILQFASEHSLWVIADEVYENQVYESGRFIYAHALASNYERLVSVRSFSKSIGMPGIRVGYMVAHPEVTKRARRALQFMTYCVPALWQYGCIAALDDNDFFERQYAIFDEARMRTARALGVAPPSGGIYHFMEARGDAMSIADSLLRELDVALAPGQVGGDRYRSWLRMCFTSLQPDEAEEGARRVAEWLRERHLLVETHGSGHDEESEKRR